MAGWTSRRDTVRRPAWLEAGSTRQRRSGACSRVVLRRAFGPVVGYRQGLLPYGRRPVRTGSPTGLPMWASRLGLSSEARPGSVVWHRCVDHADRSVVRRVMAATQCEGRSVSAGGRDGSPRCVGSELLHAVHEARRSRLRQRAFAGAQDSRAVDIVRELRGRLLDHDRGRCDQPRGSNRGRSLAALVPPLQQRTIRLWMRHVLERRRPRSCSASYSCV